MSATAADEAVDGGRDARRGGALLGRRQQVLVVVVAVLRRRAAAEGAALEEQVGHPEGDAVEQDDGRLRGAGGGRTHGRRHLDRALDRGPRRRTRGLVRAHALLHLLVVRLGRGDVGHPAAVRLGQLRREPLGVRALAAACAACDQDESTLNGPVVRCVHRSPPSRRCRSDLPAQVSWLALRPTGRAFPPLGAVARCGVRRRLQLRGSAGLVPASLQLRDARQGYSRGGWGVNRGRWPVQPSPASGPCAEHRPAPPV